MTASQPDTETRCGRCGHGQYDHDKIDNEVVYGFVGECLAVSCECSGFIELDAPQPDTETLDAIVLRANSSLTPWTQLRTDVLWLAARLAETEAELQEVYEMRDEYAVRVSTLEAEIAAASQQLRREGYIALADRLAALDSLPSPKENT